MIKIGIAEKAKSKGFENPYSLQKALNISPTVAARLWKGDFKKIGIDTIDKLCTLLKCQVSELLFFVGEVDTPAQTPKVVNKIIRTVKTAQNDVSGLLSLPQVAEKLGLSRKRVNDYVNQGKLKATKNSRGHNFVSETDLQAFIDS